MFPIETVSISPIAHIESDFTSKFGIPRQSGLVEGLFSRIVFEPEFRNPDALRGIEDFSHLWLIWQFSENVEKGWSPTVRPPRLGGNQRKGVFATRSPFRPNALGLSCVELISVETDPTLGPVLVVKGADLMNGTPIFDVKPYVPFSDSHPDALGGFADKAYGYSLKVEFPPKLLEKVPEAKREALTGILAQDPRPRYQHDPQRIYGFPFAGLEIKFRVDEDRLIVCDILPAL